MRLLLAGGDGEGGFPSCRVSGEVNFLKNNNKRIQVFWDTVPGAGNVLPLVGFAQVSVNLPVARSASGELLDLCAQVWPCALGQGNQSWENIADALLLTCSLNLSIDLKQKMEFCLSCSPDTSLQLSRSETSVSVSETSPGEFTTVPPQSH